MAPRDESDVSDVTRVNHGGHFSWQAQNLVRLDGHTMMLRAMSMTFHL